MTFSMKSRTQSDFQNMHDSDRLYYLGFYLDYSSLIVSDLLMNKVHELILFRHKSHVMISSPSITLGMSLSKLLTVILSKILR